MRFKTSHQKYNFTPFFRYFTHFYTVLLLCLILGASALCLSACGSSSKSHVIIAGSTSVQPYAELLAEEFTRLYPEGEIDVQGGGSSAGISAAESGTAEIGMSSRHLTEKESHLIGVEIAIDGLAVIIHPSNPIENLSLEQIRQIYTLDITDWSALGGPSSKIHIIAREEGSGTRSAFEELVMDQRAITPKCIIQDSNGAVRQLVSDDPYSIGYISLGLLDGSVKALKLDGVTPSAEAIEDGTYKLFRPFLYVMKTEPEGFAKEFLDFTMSPEGQAILIDEGLIPPTQGALQP